MILTLDTERLRTLEEIRTFMEGNRPVFSDNQDENVAIIKMRKHMSRAWGGRA